MKIKTLLILCVAVMTIMCMGFPPNSHAGTVDLDWTAPGDDGDAGTVSGYEIRFSKQMITEENWNAATPAGSSPTPLEVGSPQSYALIGLESETTYYVAIKSYDNKPNWSGISNVIQFTTTDDIAPDDIVDLTVTIR